MHQMFSKLRNFSEDVAKSLNEFSAEEQRKNPVKELQSGNKILHTKTPDPNDLSQPQDEAEMPMEHEESLKTSEQKEQTNIDLDAKHEKTIETNSVAPRIDKPSTPNVISGIDLETLTPQVRAKMKKFAKYEEKYPLLLEAYKTEKRKSELIDMFEKLLSENTPISSISDAGVLIDYLKGLNEKTTMLNVEMRRLSREKTNLAKSKTDLENTVSDINQKIKEYEAKINELELNPSASDLTVNDLSASSEIEALKLQLKTTENDLASRKSEIDELRVSLTQLEESSSTLSQENELLRELKARDEEQLTSLKSESEQARSELESKTKELEAKAELLRKEKDGLELKLASLESSSSSLSKPDASVDAQPSGNKK